MIEPLPNCFSICASAAASALFLWSSMVLSRGMREAPKYGAAAGAGGYVDGADHCIERSFDATPPNGRGPAGARGPTIPERRTDPRGSTCRRVSAGRPLDQPFERPLDRGRAHRRAIAARKCSVQASTGRRRASPTRSRRARPACPACRRPDRRCRSRRPRRRRRFARARPRPSRAPSPRSRRRCAASVSGRTPSISIFASFE